MENAVGRLYVKEAFAGDSKHLVMLSAQHTTSPRHHTVSLFALLNNHSGS
jgi:hypothetical protein